MTRTIRTLGSLAVAGVAAAALAVPAMSGPTASAATTAVTANMTEMKFALNKKSVKTGTINFKLVNKGMIKHDLKIAGKKSAAVAPGKTGKLTVKIAKPGKYPYICTLPGHAAAGMKGVLTVKR